MAWSGWDTVASFFSPITNFVSSLFTNAANKEQVQETNAANMAMNAQNIQFQKEENEIARLREDNAVQRRAADLEAAGLSKTLAAGSPASANAMNAPNNSFGVQSARFDAPRFDFDYSAAKHNLAAAQAAGDNAEAAKTSAAAADRESRTKERQQKFEMLKFAVEHGMDLKKFGLEMDKFEHQKSMDEKSYELKKFVEETNLSLEEKKYQLSVDELNLKRDELNNKIMDSVSERSYRSWRRIYESAELELDRNADKRAASLAKYQITEIEAKVAVYLSEVKLNDAQIAFVKKNTKKVVAEILHYYDQHNQINADILNTLQKTITEIYDRSVAEADGGKTNDKTVTSSEAHQNALDRATQESVAGTASMRQFFSIVLMALMGFSKGVKLP